MTTKNQVWKIKWAMCPTNYNTKQTISTTDISSYVQWASRHPTEDRLILIGMADERHAIIEIYVENGDEKQVHHEYSASKGFHNGQELRSLITVRPKEIVLIK